MPALTPATPTEQEFQQLSEMYVRACLHGADLAKERDRWRTRAEHLATLDARFRLVGDEDTNVGIDCRDCDRGGAPIAYLTSDARSYAGTDVVIVSSIADLLAAAADHEASVHADPEPATPPRTRYIDRHGDEWIVGDNGLMHHHSYSQRSMDTLQREYGPLRKVD